MAKLDNNYTLHLDTETSDLIEKLASYYNRKPCELLRLILVPQLIQEWAKVQAQEHQENQDKIEKAIFRL